MNYIKLFFSTVTILLGVFGILINKYGKRASDYVNDVMCYGKISTTKKHKLLIQVPKSWFKHFYIYSSLLNTFVLTSAILKLTYGLLPLHSFLVDILELVNGSTRFCNVSETSAILASFLYTLHLYRRFYETHFVSVFSKNGKMNILHYLLSLVSFTLVILAIVIETSIFTRNARANTLQWTDLKMIDIIALTLFLWASWKQYKLGIILANLRKNKKGIVITQEHKLPKGDWFDYVSSPHLLAEILIYTALTIILRNNGTWMYVFVFVLYNQIECALLSHWWYQETFKDMPKHRKALIPFIY